MSEVAPNIVGFKRKLPEAVANDEINRVFREALSRARDEARSKSCATRDEYADAIIESFYHQLGTGPVECGIEDKMKGLPDRYLGVLPRKETALKFFDRVDFRSLCHPAVLSPIVGINVNDSDKVSYAGTDKFGHVVQHGYDYFLIYSAVEAAQPGLGTLFAQAWGTWSEGEAITESEVEKYLKERTLPSDAAHVKHLKKQIDKFMLGSETIEFMNPTFEFVKRYMPLRKIGHKIGSHQLGILGTTSTGIISYADLIANEDGLRFYLDLKKDPDSVVENFDIKNYASIKWDEEVLKSKFIPVAEARLAEAKRGERNSFFVKGLGFDYEFPRNLFSLSAPFVYYPTPGGDVEMRLRAGASVSLSGEGNEYKEKSRIYPEADICARVSGLFFACGSAAVGFTQDITSDSPLDGVIPSIGAGIEAMLLGWTSFRLGWKFEPRDKSSSGNIGALMMWR